MPPLVYVKTRAARQAARLMPGVVLENAVASAILRGRVCAGTKGGYVFLDDEALVARVERAPGRLRQRPRQWLITGLEVHRDTIEGGNGNGNGSG